MKKSPFILHTNNKNNALKQNILQNGLQYSLSMAHCHN